MSPLSCDVKAFHCLPTDLKGNSWPDSSQLHLIPEETVKSVDEKLIARDERKVFIQIDPCIELEELTKALQHGMVGSVTFAPSPGCDIQILILWYSEEDKMFIGIIPEHQNEFIR